MDGDFGTYVKYFLSILVGVCCVGGGVVFFNYDKFEDPEKRRKQLIVGLSMIILGLGVSTAYHYARRDNNLPDFLTKSEGQKQADKQLKKEKAEQKAKDKENPSSKAEDTEDKGDDKGSDGKTTESVKKEAEPVVKAKSGEKVVAIKHLATKEPEEFSEPSPDSEDIQGNKK